ncbi:MAG: MBL fold metallo-hydrolase [Acetivibrio sp.]
MENQIVFLGTRGSIPVCSRNFEKYGGETSSVFVALENTVFILDAGTGIMELKNYLPKEIKKINLLISHTHLDHIQGLLLWPMLFDEKYEINIYIPKNNEMDAKTQIVQLFQPPLWPVGTDVFKAKVNYITLKENEFYIENTKIKWIKSNHPGGSVIYRLDNKKNSIVYGTDYEHDTEIDESFCKFAKEAKVLIYDAQYLPEEYEKYKGFGHSTWKHGMQIAKKSKAKQTLFFHHDPKRTDEEMTQLETMIQEKDKTCSFAKNKEEVIL